MLGAQVDIITGLSAGLSLALPVINITGSSSMSMTTHQSMPDPPMAAGDKLEIISGKSDVSYNKPMRVRAGLGYEKAKSFAVSCDIEYVMGTEKLLKSNETDTTTTYDQGLPAATSTQKLSSKSGTRSVFNLYLGGEYFITDNWIVRAGFFMLPADVKPFEKTGSEILTMRVDRYGFSLGGAHATDTGETAFGITFVYGSGKTITEDYFTRLGGTAHDYKEIGVDHYMIAIFFSGTVDFARL
jgi:hypothetical protein